MASKRLRQLIDDDKKYLFQNYGDRLPVCFVKGDGSYLYDQDNKKYIDFFSGIAVSAVGYGRPGFIKRLNAQIDRIIHSSNWYINREQIETARLISDLSFKGKTLFVNTGTEANEAAIKLARKYGISSSPERYRIIAFQGCFHGRTLGSMSATGQEKIRKGFGPLVPGFSHLPFNDTEAFIRKVDSSDFFCAVIMELIQGEGGIRLADKKFVRTIAEICKRKNILLIIDEVQTGIGRTGLPFAYQHYGISPDIITMAKGLGGGIPIGAVHAKDKYAAVLERGTHGTTFGGNHLACAAAGHILSEIKKESFINNVRNTGEYIVKRLTAIQEKAPIIKEIRHMGLHIGVELDRNGMDIVKKALGAGLVINCTNETVIRIMPPLTITGKIAKEGLNILEDLLIEEASVI